MRYETQGTTVTCWLEGRVTADNAGDAERELRTAADGAHATRIVLDASDLAYIASAGPCVPRRPTPAWADRDKRPRLVWG